MPQKLRFPTPDEVAAILRHVYSVLGIASAVLLAVGMSQGDVTALGEAVHRIGDGAAAVLMGIAALVPVISAIRAAVMASPLARIKAIAAMPGTSVSPSGNTITLHVPEMAQVAKDNATPAAKL